MTRNIAHHIAAVCSFFALASSVLAQGTAFTYQGQLQDSGSPASGSYDIQFTLFASNITGVAVGGPVTNTAVAVTNGLFTTLVDFGNAYTGASNWLEIAVSTNGANAFVTLAPRQQLTPVPYALFAGSASNFNGLISANQLTGTVPLAQLPAAVVTNGATFNAGGATNIPAYSALSGQLILQNGMSLVIQTNGTSPFSVANWYGYSMLTTPTLTNAPQIAIYCGYPTNVIAFGYLNSLVAWTANTGGNPDQTGEFRVKTAILGNQLGIYTSDAGVLWLRADGAQWVEVPAGNLGNNIYTTITLPNFGRHEIEMHFEGNIVLAGIYVPITNSFVNVPQPTQTGNIIGDSITDGAAGYGGEQLWPAQLEDLLIQYGINLIPQGEGGTGYVAAGPTPGEANFLNRLTNCVASFHPDFVIWAGGINDLGVSNQLYAAETNCYGLLKSLLPSCKQFVIAPWGSFTLGQSVGVDQITSNAAAAYGLPIIYPEYTTNNAWITGDYNVPGSGNAPAYWSGNGPHPNALGHQFYADQVANFVLTNLMPTASASLW